MSNSVHNTPEQIIKIVQNAQHSVWAIEDMIEKINSGEPADQEKKDTIDRNVRHLQLVVESQEVLDSGEDIADLVAGIAVGEAKLAENIWAE